MKKFFLLSAVLFAGCATSQLENIGVETNNSDVVNSIVLSYDVKQEYSTKYFGMINFALENKTNNWLQVDSIELLPLVDSSITPVLNNDPDNIDITGGENLDIWFKAMSLEKQVESTNRQMVWGSISLGAHIGGMLSNDNNVKNTAAALGTISHEMMTMEKYNLMREQNNLSNYYPEDHLFRTPFRIPPGLTVNKWIVINSQIKSPDEPFAGMRMKMYFQDKIEKEYELRFIPDVTTYSGTWQHTLIHNTYQVHQYRKHY
ncbi:MAG TPA: hypothetical protein VMU30_04340 [Bacteroidota bacterium]|nr:hypothetical protein [Bacteroidota bacterium]